MQLDSGNYDLVIANSKGHVFNRRRIKPGMSESERLSILTELVTLKAQWESSGHLSPDDHLKIEIVQ